MRLARIPSAMTALCLGAAFLLAGCTAEDAAAPASTAPASTEPAATAPPSAAASTSEASETQAPATSPPAVVTGPTRRCRSERGSVTDVAHEPDYRRWSNYADWTTQEGCLLRIDVLAERSGPKHCNYEKARVLVTGRPVGNRHTSPQDAAHYIRDPHGVFRRPRVQAGFDPDAALPEDATDTGYRRGSVQLWSVPGAAAVFMVDGDTIERWPRGRQRLCG